MCPICGNTGCVLSGDNCNQPMWKYGLDPIWGPRRLSMTKILQDPIHKRGHGRIGAKIDATGKRARRGRKSKQRNGEGRPATGRHGRATPHGGEMTGEEATGPTGGRGGVAEGRATLEQPSTRYGGAGNRRRAKRPVM